MYLNVLLSSSNLYSECC